jgi:hypothetical protein
MFDFITIRVSIETILLNFSFHSALGFWGENARCGQQILNRRTLEYAIRSVLDRQTVTVKTAVITNSVGHRCPFRLRARAPLR